MKLRFDIGIEKQKLTQAQAAKRLGIA